MNIVSQIYFICLNLNPSSSVFLKYTSILFNYFNHFYQTYAPKKPKGLDLGSGFRFFGYLVFGFGYIIHTQKTKKIILNNLIRNLQEICKISKPKKSKTRTQT